MLTGYRFEAAQDMDEMYESDTNAEWERLNEPETTFDWQVEEALKEAEVADTEMLKLAGKSLSYAVRELDECLDSVNEAMENLIDTPEGDRLGSILAEMEERLKELKEMQSKWEQGEQV